MKSELFLLAVSSLGAGGGVECHDRFAPLVREVAVDDPVWTAAFLGWLRGQDGLRGAALTGAMEATKAMLANGLPGSRGIVESVLRRADDPGDALSYWVERYGRSIPKPVKRAMADAVARLYTEPAMLKHDTAAKGFRFADVIALVHPAPRAPWQADLFRVARDRRHQRAEISSYGSLPMLAANARLRAAADSTLLLDPARLKAAGMTWEGVLSLAGSDVERRLLWPAVIPSMGYLALLLNLRHFDEADVHDDVAAGVSARIADPARVARSGQLPFRFVTVHEQSPSLRWGHALARALQASLANLPRLPGRTLVLVDTSASMANPPLFGPVTVRTPLTPAKAAAVFAVALAAGGDGVELFGFADGRFRHEVPPDGPVLKEANRFLARTGEAGHATRAADALRATYSGQERVVIISDRSILDAEIAHRVPPKVPVYAINLGAASRCGPVTTSPGRHELTSLDDATFRMIPLLEAGVAGAWPWLMPASWHIAGQAAHVLGRPASWLHLGGMDEAERTNDLKYD
ncbi:MAG TPA: TROVE domain-containing protein [Candidatus Limnocylindrales bacterium]